MRVVLKLPPESYAEGSAGRLLPAGKFKHRAFGHCSVGDGGLESINYMSSLFNREKRFRVNIEHIEHIKHVYGWLEN